jgi:TnsA-like endonuclease N terminal
MAGSAALAASAAAGSSFDVVFVDEAGCRLREPLSSCWDRAFEGVAPVRSFLWAKDRVNWPGYWWSVTTGHHVGYESWVERDVAMMLDFDREVVGFSSQPFWLYWVGQSGQRRHAPDFFVRLADGGGVVLDVRPDDQVDAAAAETFAVTARACTEVGWEFRRAGGPPTVLAANVRWLAGYRHPRCQRPDIAADLLRVFSQPTPLLAGAREVSDPIVVLPMLYHLMWRQVLQADLTSTVLGPRSLVRSAEGTG